MRPRGSIIYRMEPKKTLKQFSFYTGSIGLSSIQSSFESQKIKKKKTFDCAAGGLWAACFNGGLIAHSKQNL